MNNKELIVGFPAQSNKTIQGCIFTPTMIMHHLSFQQLLHMSIVVYLARRGK